jgi:hypothetical protein
MSLPLYRSAAQSLRELHAVALAQATLLQCNVSFDKIFYQQELNRHGTEV